MVVSRIGRKNKKKQASVGEPPVLTPAASLASDSPPSLYEYLRNSGYLIDRTSADLMQVVLALPSMRAVLLEGPPGVGKTALTEKIAQWLGAEYIYVLATPNTDEDTLLYKFVPDENTKSGIRVAEGPLVQAVKKAAAGRKVVLVLDNSGSMVEWADMLRAMAELAAKRRDVEVYLAPNGYVEEQIAPVRRKVSHDEFMKRTSGRKIIYVGDFDGANTPIELSWRNEVIWIAPESRYKRFLSHSWVKYDETKYKGAFIRVFNMDDIMKGLKRVLGGARWIDMCKKCEL